MLKTTQPGSYDFGEAMMSLVKIGSRGLLGYDRNMFIKRAAADIAHNVDRIKLHPGEKLAHLIGIGAFEHFGANRNGDAFYEQVCRDCHPTFVKYAKFYRNHKKKSGDPSFGRIIESAYNEPMRRVELLVGLNGDQRAAEKNGGQVADKELEKLARGEDMGVSMSCLVSHDTCSSCGNKAKKKKDYCTEGMCKRGGLKRNIGRICEDGHQLHAINDDPVFIDMSHITCARQADRIAYATGILKAAAVGGGREVVYPVSDSSYLRTDAAVRFFSKQAGEQLKLLDELVDWDEKIGSDVGCPYDGIYSTKPRFRPPTIADDLELRRFNKAAQDAKILLSPEEFCMLTGCDEKLAIEGGQQMRSHLPGIFDVLRDDPDLDTELSGNPYCQSSSPCPRMSLWAKQAATYSFTDEAVRRSVRMAAIRGDRKLTSQPAMMKLARDTDDGAETLARDYALYQLAFLSAVRPRSNNFGSMVALTLRQNHLR